MFSYLQLSFIIVTLLSHYCHKVYDQSDINIIDIESANKSTSSTLSSSISQTAIVDSNFTNKPSPQFSINHSSNDTVITASHTIPTPIASNSKKSSMNELIMIAFIIVLMITVCLAILVWFLCRKKKTKDNNENDYNIEEQKVIETENIESIESIHKETDENKSANERNTIRSRISEPINSSQWQTELDKSIEESAEKENLDETEKANEIINENKLKHETQTETSNQAMNSPESEQKDSNVMHTIDERKTTIK